MSPNDFKPFILRLTLCVVKDRCIRGYSRFTWPSTLIEWIDERYLCNKKKYLLHLGFADARLAHNLIITYNLLNKKISRSLLSKCTTIAGRGVFPTNRTSQRSML